ncbi:MAG: DNA polymerase III subunit delta [Planctomycetes bacterium]|nr:DNA polymerase III subunit delta [Planctomycetota bacterium]
MADDGSNAIYVLHGKDAFLREDARKAIIHRLVGDADPQTCLATFDGEAALAEVLDELRTLPFLASHRVVIVREADAFVSANRETLEDYFENPSSSGTLILEVGAWPKNTKLAKKLPAAGKLIECDSPQGGKLVTWIRKAGQRHGKVVDNAAAALLAEWVGNDLATLENELAKLACYVGNRETVTADDVTAVVAATAGPEAFAVTNAVIAGDIAAALRATFAALQTRGAEFALLGQLAWHVRRSLQAVQAIRAGQNRQSAIRAAKVFYNQREFEGMLKRRGERKLQQDMRRVLRADLGMKGGLAARAAMQDLVVQLCI